MGVGSGDWGFVLTPLAVMQPPTPHTIKQPLCSLTGGRDKETERQRERGREREREREGDRARERERERERERKGEGGTQHSRLA